MMFLLSRVVLNRNRCARLSVMLLRWPRLPWVNSKCEISDPFTEHLMILACDQFRPESVIFRSIRVATLLTTAASLGIFASVFNTGGV